MPTSYGRLQFEIWMYYQSNTESHRGLHRRFKTHCYMNAADVASAQSQAKILHTPFSPIELRIRHVYFAALIGGSSAAMVNHKIGKRCQSTGRAHANILQNLITWSCRRDGAMAFGNTTRVLAERMFKYFRIL